MTDDERPLYGGAFSALASGLRDFVVEKGGFYHEANNDLCHLPVVTLNAFCIEVHQMTRGFHSFRGHREFPPRIVWSMF